MVSLNRKKLWARYCSLWQDLSGWQLFLFYTLHYTLLFIVLQSFVFSSFYAANKSFIWGTDGVCSYLPRMSYISKVVRDGIQSILSGNGWSIPLYDFRMGPAQLDLQVEPIQWLSIFWPWDQLDGLYDILVIVRYYLVGLSFSMMGFYFKQRLVYILIGAVSYTFCGFALHGSLKHPWFLASMIFLPLLVIGAEKILNGEKSLLFTGTVFLGIISSLYFFCMLAILICIYILVRFFCVYNQGIKSFFQTIKRALFWGGTGIALSGIILIPTLLQMLGTGRIGRDVGELWHYSLAYYQRFITSFIMQPGSIGSWTILGFSVLSVPAVLLLFLDKTKSKQQRSLKVLFAVMTLLICSPTFAYMMSGFNAVSARWCFAYALCVATINMIALPKLQAFDKTTLLAAAGGTIAYVILCGFVVHPQYSYKESLILLLLALLFLSLRYLNGKKGRRLIALCCCLITLVSVNYSAFWLYDKDKMNYISEFVDKDEVYSIYEAGQYRSLSESDVVAKDEGFFKVSANNLSNEESGMAFFYELNGLCFYTSSIIDNYKSIENDLEIIQHFTNNRKFGIDGRAPILSLFNVKYDAVRGNAPIPYGFKEVDRVNKDIILENLHFLPVGYTYDICMDRGAFDRLSPIEKQEAMLQAVVLGDGAEQTQVCEEPNLLSEKMPIKITVADGISWKDGTLKVKKENATLTLSFEGLAEADTYLRVVNLDLTRGSSTRKWNLTVSTEDTLTYARFSADGYLYSNGAKNQVLYLGNSPDGYTTCSLTFPQKGTFILDDLEIWCQPMDHYAEQIEALRAEPLENVETNWRGLTGTVDLSKDKMMCFGIPYETGWSVYVDGEKRELMQANIGLMAVELEEGFHKIELRYWTPGLTTGIILSCIGLTALICVIIWQRKKMKKS